MSGSVERSLELSGCVEYRQGAAAAIAASARPRPRAEERAKAAPRTMFFCRFDARSKTTVCFVGEALSRPRARFGGGGRR
jgi:hypothetical protein